MMLIKNQWIKTAPTRCNIFNYNLSNRLKCEGNILQCFSSLWSVLFALQSCGMMDCTHGKTRKKTHSALSRRRSPLLCLISFSLCPVLVLSLPSVICTTFGAAKTDVSCHCTVYLSLTALLRPYIVYMLQDLDILEDWTAIRKVF